jgi:hypothetical protein
MIEIYDCNLFKLDNYIHLTGGETRLLYHLYVQSVYHDSLKCDFLFNPSYHDFHRIAARYSGPMIKLEKYGDVLMFNTTGKVELIPIEYYLKWVDIFSFTDLSYAANAKKVISLIPETYTDLNYYLLKNFEKPPYTGNLLDLKKHKQVTIKNAHLHGPDYFKAFCALISKLDFIPIYKRKFMCSLSTNRNIRKIKKIINKHNLPYQILHFSKRLKEEKGITLLEAIGNDVFAEDLIYNYILENAQNVQYSYPVSGGKKLIDSFDLKDAKDKFVLFDKFKGHMNKRIVKFSISIIKKKVEIVDISENLIENEGGQDIDTEKK